MDQAVKFRTSDKSQFIGFHRQYGRRNEHIWAQYTENKLHIELNLKFR